MEPIKPTPTLTSKICIQHEPADGGDAASGTIGGLPFHLTEEILRCVSPLDSVRLATVCRSWAATISERLARPTPHLFALEVLHEHPRGAIFSVPVDDNEEDSPAPAMPAMGWHAECFELCGASSSGSLSFVNGSHVLLVNPVTGASGSVQISASISRTGPKLCTGAEAFFITEFHRGVSLWWWCSDEWSEQKLLLPQGFEIYHAIALSAYSGGVLYALEFSGLVYTMDTQAPLPWRLTRLRAPSILEQYSPIFGYRFIRNCHLLESEDEVMFVGPVFATKEPGCPKSICGFEVYRLDVHGARWVKVERLAGEQALFVSDQSSFALHASEVPGCMSNCIYFVGDVDECSFSTWGIYSMEERKVLFQSPVGGLPGKYKAARWFFPGVVMPLARQCTNLGQRRKINGL
ncbi:uncharacterized protein [Aegilops tauschii subsp. strangulata]|nr:uncharacterized protein LOC109738777 [Aegilops tauschii subsp. strangulata]